MTAHNKFLKPAYIGGPLTELRREDQVMIKKFYEALADICYEVLGIRGWVPHEHYDPVAHKDFTPAQIYSAEHDIVCNKTGLIVVCAYAPSWGGGMEVAWAAEHGVPGVLLCDRLKLEARQVSRLLRGSPIFAGAPLIAGESYDDAAAQFKNWLVAQVASSAEAA